MLPLPLHICFELAALIIGLLLWKSLGKSTFRLFVPFLTFIMIVELTGRYLRKVLHQPNVWLYNFSMPLEYLFFTYIIHQHYSSRSFRLVARWFTILFITYVVISLTFISRISTFNSSAVTVGNVGMILLSLLSLYDIYLQEDDIPVWKQSIFWVAAGVLLFNAGEFSYHLMSGYLIRHGFENTEALFKSINNKLIYVLYSFIIIAFICVQTAKPYRKV
jgi:hypothetical protein